MINQIKKSSNGMKRVLIFSTAYLPLIGGAEVAVKEITDRLGDFSAKGGPASGWEFDLITSKIDKQLPREEKIGRVYVYRLGLGAKTDKFFLPLLGFIKALNLHHKNNYSLIWSLMASQASIAASLFKIFKPNIKLSLNLQEGDEEEHLKRYVLGNEFLYKILIKPWHLLVFKKADYLTVISQYLKNRALANGVKTEIDLVPNGVDVNIFGSTIYINKKELKRDLGIDEREKVIITASRLVKKNGIDDLIKSALELSKIKKDIGFKFLIMGDGPDREKLESLAKELGVAKNIIFFGKYENKGLPKYLAISDVFVRPSLSEGQGISFLEAMISGVPIIGTPVGGIPDFLKNGETGLFCSPRNPKSIAEKILQYVEDDTLREKITNNAKNLVINNYNWDAIADKINTIFNKLTI